MQWIDKFSAAKLSENLPVLDGIRQGITACVVNCHKSSMEHINIEAHNPEFRMASNALYHWLVKFSIQCVQFLAAKTFICRGHCYAVSTTNTPLGVPTLAFELNDSALFRFLPPIRPVLHQENKLVQTETAEHHSFWKENSETTKKISTTALVFTTFHLIAKSLFPISYVIACCWPSFWARNENAKKAGKAQLQA